MEENVFEQYYNESIGNTPPGPPPKEEGGVPEFLKDEPKREPSADAKTIKSAISLFIRNLNKSVHTALNLEKVKGTRPDLIVTLIAGGIAFVAANVYFLLVKELSMDMTEETYESTFMDMLRSGLRDIKKNNGGI